MGAESTPATSAHKERTHSPIARGIRDTKWTGQPLGCLVCAWPLLLAFQLGTRVAGILSIRNLRDFSGWCLFTIAHCGGRSFQKPIVHMH